MQTFNITSATTTTLKEIHGRECSINSIRMTNTSQSTSVRVSLFFEDRENPPDWQETVLRETYERIGGK